MKALIISDKKPKDAIKLLSINCDIIIILGDLCYDDLLELKYINKIKIGVHGNHDFRCNNDFYKKDFFNDLGIINLHLTTFKYRGLIFAGFKGLMPYVFAENNIPYKNLDLTKYQKELFKLNNLPKADVFITHSPSYKTLDIPYIIGHRGLKAFRNYIDRVSPKYHFHGHIHKQDKAIINKTKIYSVYPYLIIDL